MNKQPLNSISATISADRLRKLYARLEDEATPYALRVGKALNRTVAVTLYCDEDNIAYFQKILV